MSSVTCSDCARVIRTGPQAARPTPARPATALAAMLAALAIGCAACSDHPAISADGGAVDLDSPDLMPPPIGPAGRFDQETNVDGVYRNYILVVPDSAVVAMAAGPVPLLIALHGAGDREATPSR